MAFGRRSKSSPPATEQDSTRDLSGFEPIPGAGDAPCLPCAAAKEARQFSLNAPELPPIADDAVPSVATGVRIDVTEDGVDLAVEGAERTFALNATAGLIWLTIDGQLDVAGIIAVLAQETGASPEQIAPDIRSSIATFAGQGLVTVSSR